jgi:integrase
MIKVRIDLPGVNTVTKRLANGSRRIYYYHRATGLRLPDDPASEEFRRRVEELNSGGAAPAVPAEEAPAGSFAALIIAYRSGPEWRQLKPKTQKDYLRYLEVIRETWGTLAVAKLERRHVLALRDKYSANPRTANYIVQVLRLLLTWAVDRGLRKDNPALRPKLLKTGEGHRPWEEEEIAAMRQRWAIGTWERTAFELLLNTGQRGGDVAPMVRAQIKGGEISVAQEKTGARVWVPVSAELKEALDAWLPKLDGLVLLPGARKRSAGRPLTIDAFRHRMADAYAEADLPDDCTTHGLRYTAATVLHELGCDWETIASITGHETVAMVRKYIEKRRRARLAIDSLNRARKRRRKERAGNASANRN